MRKWLPALMGAGLCLMTLVIWWPVLGNDFINFDDDLYVTRNYQIKHGLTWETAGWAFQTGRAGNWHPLTWLSHALDCQLYGVRPAGHHLTSLILHALNTGLLFFLLRLLTGSLWRSSLVAALFALHPLRVESVAWVAERKDVLSAFFFLLTLCAYAHYAAAKDAEERRVSGDAGQHGQECEIAKVRTAANGASIGTDVSPTGCARATARRFTPQAYYVLALVFFSLGLMSKPMLVTVPFLLLLLDYWPFQRWPAASLQHSPIQPLRLLVEKLPFLALALAIGLVTLLVQKAGGNTAPVPVWFRLANTPVACAAYLVKEFWPQPLAVLYPRPRAWPAGTVVGALGLLGGVTALVVWRGRERRYWVTGWLWFLGMLAPVLGWVAVGNHWCADRYTYLPSIGLALLIVWAAAELVPDRVLGQKVLPIISLLALGACAVVTRGYLRDWKNSLTLFEHTLAVTRSNDVAYLNAAAYLRAKGEHARAGEYCAKALLLSPASAPAWDLMALVLADEGKLPEALACASNSIAAKPDWNAEAYYTRGTIYLDLGRRSEAKADLERALQLNPEYVPACLDLATLLTREGQLDRALKLYGFGLRLEPDQPVGQYDFANALTRAGRPGEALEHYERSLQLDPTNAATHCNLAQALLQLGHIAPARAHFETALRLEPGLAQAHYGLGVALSQLGQPVPALAQLRLALLPNPDFPAALGQLAWLLATTPDPDLRQGTEALQAAERACQLTDQGDPQLLASLAAARAETGRFPEAISTAQRAQALARAAGHRQLDERLGRMLEAFRAGQPYRDAADILSR